MPLLTVVGSPYPRASRRGGLSDGRLEQLDGHLAGGPEPVGDRVVDVVDPQQPDRHGQPEDAIGQYAR
jgi:hypothetical protein